MWNDPILVIEKPDFIVKLHKEWIDVDLKETGKAKLEAAIEKDPLLRKTIGFILRSTVPSDVELCDIKSVEVDEKGQLKLVIPRHVDILLPLGPERCKQTCKRTERPDTLSKNKEESLQKEISSLHVVGRLTCLCLEVVPNLGLSGQYSNLQ